jgi:hypothetical protein
MRHPLHHELSPQHLRWALAIHAALFLAANLAMAVIDLMTGPSTWFFWPLVGWGIGLAWHAFAVGRRLGWFTPGGKSHSA